MNFLFFRSRLSKFHLLHLLTDFIKVSVLLALISSLFVTLPIQLCANPVKITLMDVIKAMHEKGTQKETIAVVENSLRLKKAKISEQSIKHELTSRLTNSINEVGDNRDIESNTSNTQQVVIGYTQTYRSGLKLGVRRTERIQKAIDDEGDDEKFSKNLLTASIPLLGISSVNSDLETEKHELNLAYEESDFKRQIALQESEIASVFIDYYLYHYQTLFEQRRLQLKQMILNLARRSINQFTALNLKKLELEVKRANQKLRYQKKLTSYQVKKLNFLTALQSQDLLPELMPFKLKIEDADQLSALYIKNSTKISKLRLMVALNHVEGKLAESSDSPEITLGGFAGQTESDTTKGNNYGVYVEFRYLFGGGGNEDVEISRYENLKLSLDIIKAIADLDIEAKMDFSEYINQNELLDIQMLEIEQAKALVTLANHQFKSGDLSKTEALAYEEQLIDSEEKLIQTQHLYWNTLLSLIDKAGLVLIDLLQTS